MKSVVICAVAAVALNLSLMSVASAGPEKVTVSYAEFDLSKPAGQIAFMSRLNLAAHYLCGAEPTGAAWLEFGKAYKACMKARIDGAWARLPASVSAKLSNPRIRQIAYR